MNDHIENLIEAGLQTYAWGKRRSGEESYAVSSAQFQGAAEMMYHALRELMPELPALEDSLPECLTPSERLKRDTNTTSELDKLADI
ncbi:hypothetical protein [Corynebacterium glutamicum]|uniref:hypothetical protein n=1 Tax=Corynebacterium glutamicum TaxID=1718 RepID=UPI001B8CC3FB|nr:hypothetical protein [Corynebacterium glutamicum]